MSLSSNSLQKAVYVESVTKNQLDVLNDKASAFTFAAAAGGANVCEVTITLKDADGTTVADSRPILIWLSDDSDGVGLTSTSASGTVTAKSASGEVFGALTAKKAIIAQPLATGIFILEITDTSKTTFYVCASNLDGTGASVSDILATADYGS